MNLKKTLLLALILAGAVGYIYYVFLPQERVRASGELLLKGGQPAEFTEVTIENPSGEFSLKNAQPISTPSADETPSALASPLDVSSWRIVGVSFQEVDVTNTRALLNALADLKIDQPLPADEVSADRSVYGLASPEVKITIARPTGSTTIELGKLNEYIQKRYLALSGDATVYLVPDTLYQSAKRPLTDFRAKSPITIVDSEVKGIELHSPRGEVALESTATHEWKIASPRSVPASGSAVAGLTRTLRGAKVTEFIDSPGPLSEYGLEKPAVLVRLTFHDEQKREPIEVRFGSPPPSPGTTPTAPATYFIASSGGTVFKTLGGDLIGQLSKAFDDLRERQFLKFATDKIESLSFKPSDAPTLTLTKNGDSWLVNGKPADDPFVRELLRSFTGLSASGFPAVESQLSFDSPRATFTFSIREGNGDGSALREHTLLIGGPASSAPGAEASYFAALDDRSEPFIITESALKKISPREESLVQQKPDDGDINSNQSSAPAATSASP